MLWTGVGSMLPFDQLRGLRIFDENDTNLVRTMVSALRFDHVFITFFLNCKEFSCEDKHMCYRIVDTLKGEKV